MSDLPPERIALDTADSVEVLTLMDNACDLLLRGDERVRRAGFGSAGRVVAPLMLDASLPGVLVAEHGFSLLVTITKSGRRRTLLFDAGMSIDGLAHNVDALQIPLPDIESIVMSHGHMDHVGGLHGLVRRWGKQRLPMLVHPDFWLRRRVAIPGQEPMELATASKAAMEGAGFDVIEGIAPSLLFDGCALITGEVGRTSDFETGFAVHQAHRDGAWTPDPLILDDQALIVNVRDRGLVIVTGCGHAGIINIVRHAQALTGETRVHAVIGGFHLSGPLFEPRIGATVEALAAAAPTMIVPAHCTGFTAMRALADGLPDAFVQNSVGTRFLL